jgi:hypothetical protein
MTIDGLAKKMAANKQAEKKKGGVIKGQKKKDNKALSS